MINLGGSKLTKITNQKLQKVNGLPLKGNNSYKEKIQTVHRNRAEAFYKEEGTTKEYP